MAKRGINWRYQIGKITEYNDLSEIETLCKARREQLWRLEEEAKIAHLKTLPSGTILLVKFWQLANQRVELVRHGRKYAHIKASDGHVWRYPYRALTDKVDDKMEKMTAATNQALAPVVNALFEKTND